MWPSSFSDLRQCQPEITHITLHFTFFTLLHISLYLKKTHSIADKIIRSLLKPVLSCEQTLFIKRIIITLLTVRIGIYWTHRKSGIYREQWWCSPKRAVKPLLNFGNVKDSVQLLSTSTSRQCHENSWPGGHSPGSMINLEIKKFFNWQVVRSKEKLVSKSNPYDDL